MNLNPFVGRADKLNISTDISDALGSTSFMVVLKDHALFTKNV